jgi:hypothetical protein
MSRSLDLPEMGGSCGNQKCPGARGPKGQVSVSGGTSASGTRENTPPSHPASEGAASPSQN